MTAITRALSQYPSGSKSVVQICSTERLGGICYPGPPDSYVDALIGRAVLARQSRALEIFGTAVRSGSVRLQAQLEEFLRLLPALHAAEVFCIFDNWWPACLFASAINNATSEFVAPVSAFEQIQWLFVVFITYGVGDQFAVCPPASKDAMNSGSLYVPRQHLLFECGSGPVAGHRKGNNVRFTTADGTSLSYGETGARVPRGCYAAARVRALSWTGDIPVLNEVPALNRLAGLPTADASSVARAVPILADAFGLLRSVWPAAHSFAERCLRGVLVLKDPGYARSHSDPRAPQVLMCTARNAASVAEAVCHETAHMRLNVILERDPVLADDGAERHPSPWRKDLRPLIGLLHGVHAFLNVREFHQRLASIDSQCRDTSSFVVVSQAKKIKEAWGRLVKYAKWTSAGELVAAELESALKEL